MIQLNLLPDVKLEYIKAERSRRLVLSVSFIVAVASVVLLLLLLSVSGLQKKHLSDLTNDIKTETEELQDKPQITKILTVQNQLSSLTALHAESPAAGRLFDYLNQMTPANVSITELKANFNDQTMNITGTADSLSNVNKYIDTLKYTTFTTQDESKPQPAFNNIVLSSFSLDTGSENPAQAAKFTITLAYDPVIFDASQTVKLAVPSVTTTRLNVEQPTDLFQPAPPTSQGGQ